MHTCTASISRICHQGLPIIAYCVLSGCIPITETLSEGAGIKHERATREQGSIQVQILPHPDNQGWTVRLSQPIVRDVEETRNVTARRHYYYLQPLALPAGLFACPTSAWAWAWNLVTPTAAPDIRRNLVRYTVEACLLAVMIARSDAQISVTQTVRSRWSEPDTRTVQQARVTLQWDGPQPVDLSYSLDSDGQAVIRLRHLATAIRNAGYGSPILPKATATLSIWRNDRIVSQHPLEIGQEQLRAALQQQLPAIARAERWPRPLIMTARFQGNTSRMLGLEEHLSRIALKHQVSLITSEEIRPLLRLELEHIMSGITEDQTVVSPGHWLAPTILLTVRTEETSTDSVLSLQCHSIHTGELLAHIAVPAGPDGLSLARDVALARLDDALEAITAFRRSSLTPKPMH